MTVFTGDAAYRRGVLIVACGALLYAPDSLMIRLMGMEQWPTVFWRGAIGGVTLTVATMLIFRGGYFSALTALGRHGVYYILISAATTFCFVYAVRETAVANALFLVSTSPVFSALISWAVLKEPPDRRTARTIALALIGIAVIAFGGEKGDGSPATLHGDLAALGAAFFLAALFNVTRRARAMSMAPAIGPASLFAALIAALIAPAAMAPPPAEAWAPLLAMGVLIMPIALWCITIGPRYLPAPEVSLLMLIEAIAAPLLVWWALAEQPATATLLGGAFVLGALAWSAADRMGRRPPI